MNPWVSATRTGYNQEWDNNIQTNVTVDQKLDFITRGLSFTGRFGYDTYNKNHIYHRLWPAMYRANSRDSHGNIKSFSTNRPWTKRRVEKVRDTSF